MVQKPFNEAQLEAIKQFYQSLKQSNQEEISMTEAILAWFTEGYAEKFREQYLSANVAVLQH
ncbi:MAG: hypothetical protein D6715_03725 [Calditrichaeota bacterium]|nr:MAG: hypothetical protein D6715_03725 [Calditrichota bacterium]